MTAIPEGAQLSDDGSYWWDGADWQPVDQGGQGDQGGQDATTEQGQLSDDGQYRWDGSEWQPVEGLVLYDLDAYPTIQAWAYVDQTEDAAKDYFAQLGLDEATANGEAIA
jgi:hypothetical protein